MRAATIRPRRLIAPTLASRRAGSNPEGIKHFTWSAFCPTSSTRLSHPLCIFLLTFWPNNLIYESRRDLHGSRQSMSRENQSMKNATKKAKPAKKKKAAPKKK
jgi:hypothetical protein